MYRRNVDMVTTLYMSKTSECNCHFVVLDKILILSSSQTKICLIFRKLLLIQNYKPLISVNRAIIGYNIQILINNISRRQNTSTIIFCEEQTYTLSLNKMKEKHTLNWCQVLVKSITEHIFK